MPTASSTLPSPLAATLRAAVRGRVLEPGDDAYDTLRQVVGGGFDRRPAVIVRPVDAADVGRVIDVARETGVELAVRSGGHSGAGHSTTDGGILLDVRELRDLEIDVASKTAWVGSGLTAGEVTAALDEHDLAIGFGDTGSVGVGGITLGGGVGYLVRKHGLTIDSLLAAEIVTADGRVLRTDERSHPDLFWALRGGGGNFGVVTRFRFRLHDVSSILGGILVLPATPESIAGFMSAAEAAPEELSGISNVMPAPPMPFLPADAHGRVVILAMLAYAGEPEAGDAAIAPFRALATPLADLVRPSRYREMFPRDDGDYHPTAEALTMFIRSMDRDLAATILEHLESSDASMRVAQLRVLGGAMARVPAEATAFAHRASRIMVNVAAFYDGPEDRPRRADWVRGLVDALDQGDSGVYVNFLGDEGPARVRAAYPDSTWERLVAVKARYDPGNLFRRNQNIPPKQPG